MSTPFAKAKVVSEWGSVTYFLDDLKLYAGEVVEVLWPDGSVTAESLTGIRYDTTVYDHGHEYPVSNQRLVVSVPFRGTTVDVPITEVSLRRVKP